jgi:hypothetical protein
MGRHRRRGIADELDLVPSGKRAPYYTTDGASAEEARPVFPTMIPMPAGDAPLPTT